jgi:mono/diheme cytochrome c family protein/peroxiredoxin
MLSMLFRPILLIVLLISAASAQPASKPALIRTARVQDPVPLGVGRFVQDLTLEPLTGDKQSLSSLLKGKKGVVIAMTSVGCPAAMKYIPRLASLEDEFAKQGVAFVFVNVERAETDPDMRRVISDQRLDGPYLADRDGSIAAALGARTTTEVFVIDAARTLVFRGGVDDQYGIGSALPAPKVNFLKDAVAAMLAGARPTIRATWPPGCVLDEPPAAEPKPDNAPPTYSAEIARIVHENCVQCHRPGGGAPFALESYQNLIARAPMVEAVVRDGLMPPSLGIARDDNTPSPWAHDRSMPPRDKERLLTWLASDKPMGDESHQPLGLPPSTSSWDIGVPDLVVFTPAVKLEAQGGLRHARVVTAMPARSEAEIARNLGPDRWVRAMEFRPMEAKTFHHAVIWIMEPGMALPGPGEVPTSLQLLGAYGPGDSVIRLRPGAARRVPEGSVIVVDMYLTPVGKDMNVALRLGFLLDKESNSQTRTLIVSDPALKLAPGVTNAAVECERTLDQDTTLRAVVPLLGPRAKALHVSANFPDGTSTVLLDAPRYEFRWRPRFELLEPLTLPKGTRLVVRGTFDNSESNPTNPNPAHEAAAGVDELDEQLIVGFEINAH